LTSVVIGSSPIAPATVSYTNGEVMEITRVCMAVEIDGKPHFVMLPQERMLMLVDFAATLSDNGKLPVLAAPDEFKFETLGMQK
jgi:hypothetical protein